MDAHHPITNIPRFEPRTRMTYQHARDISLDPEAHTSEERMAAFMWACAVCDNETFPAPLREGARIIGQTLFFAAGRRAG